MVTVYCIQNTDQQCVYVGMTEKKPQIRLKEHQRAARLGLKSPIYTHMRDNGIDNFSIVELENTDTREAAAELEKQKIIELSETTTLYNSTPGGELGNRVVKECNREEWKEKLKQARSGRKPALGMKHSDDNKKLFSDVSNRYWETQDTYDQNSIVGLSHREAKAQLGISTTHYYRLKKRLANSNDVG